MNEMPDKPESDPPAEAEEKGKFQFSILTLLIIMLVLSVVFVWIGYKVREVHVVYVGMPMSEATKLVSERCPDTYDFPVGYPFTGEVGVGHLPLLDDDTSIQLIPSEKDASLLGKIILQHGSHRAGTYRTEEVKSVKLP